MTHCCDCGVDTQALEMRQRNVLLVVLAITALTSVMMVGASALSGSSSLLAGTLDNFGDAVTYGLSFAALGASAAAKARVVLFKGWTILVYALVFLLSAVRVSGNARTALASTSVAACG